MRGEAALKARFPKEAKKNASISPYDRGIAETHCSPPASECQMFDENHSPCEGDLLQVTEKGTNCKSSYIVCEFILLSLFLVYS